jgi:hypothetical protein
MVSCVTPDQSRDGRRGAPPRDRRQHKVARVRPRRQRAGTNRRSCPRRRRGLRRTGLAVSIDTARQRTCNSQTHVSCLPSGAGRTEPRNVPHAEPAANRVTCCNLSSSGANFDADEPCAITRNFTNLQAQMSSEKRLRSASPSRISASASDNRPRFQARRLFGPWSCG